MIYPLIQHATLHVGGSRPGLEMGKSQNRRNVADHLPKACQKDYDRRVRNAYAMTHYAEAKAELEKIVRQLERINPSAADSLEEGLEETLTVHRLGVGAPASMTFSKGLILPVTFGRTSRARTKYTGQSSTENFSHSNAWQSNDEAGIWRRGCHNYLAPPAAAQSRSLLSGSSRPPSSSYNHHSQRFVPVQTHERMTPACTPTFNCCFTWRVETCIFSLAKTFQTRSESHHRKLASSILIHCLRAVRKNLSNSVP